METRLAIVGFGGYGWNLIDWIGQAGEECGCRLVAAAGDRLAERGSGGNSSRLDTSLADKADELSRRGVEVFDDAQAMFAAMKGRCDAVYIATGIGTHAPLTIAAAESGYHVHLEKPPAATVQEIDEMLDALRRAERMCLVGFQAVHALEVRWLSEQIASERLGRVRTISCVAGWPRAASYYSRNHWAGKLKADGTWVLDGPATNALMHYINLMLLWAGAAEGELAEPQSVRAELYAAGPVESHDTACIEIRTRGGSTAYFLASHCTQDAFGPDIRIEGERGQAQWRAGAGAVVSCDDGTTSRRDCDPHMHKRMVVNFVRAVQVGDPAVLRYDLATSRKVILALDGAHESSRKIHRIGAGHVRRLDDGTDEARTVVAGLDELLRRSADEKCLPSDLPDAPAWTVSTDTFDLSGYGRFPARFSATGANGAKDG